ncbi:Protein of unknown function [Loktanella fryxellensis]|uniref:Flagellar protein n=1 Tax=Loktanella fryxellensis TaxID=245187 RepID=A0A1H7ZR81_9RHOB|nr:DUF1217 domain-containing protein [Loktanella fryxellensis]SEM60781.1 Protein of unknown function [Loktanella fryxellensis]
MNFQPVLPLAGYGGWRFLQRTLESQQATFAESAPVKRATDQFRERIGAIQTADDLVADRQLLQVALGAFGLDDDINNRFFIAKVLSEGTGSNAALSARLADKRYAAFSAEFGLGEGQTPRTALPGFAERIINRYESRQFERAVGDQDNDLRSALNLTNGLRDIVSGSGSNTARWFSIMGDPPVRAVIETALGLPASIGRLDIDRQLDMFKDRARATFGTDAVADLTDPASQEKLIRLFLIRSEASASAATSNGAIALTLLQNTLRPA